jgi:hypothetical protein
LSAATHENRILNGKGRGVIRARKRYSFTRTCKYTFSLLGALRWLLRTW